MSNNKPILTAGNDFYLRVNVYTRNAQGEREPFNLSACDKWAFFLRNTYGAITEATFGLEEGSVNTILVDCKDIKRSMGYTAEVVAVLNGRNVRCAERGVFAITGYNADANVTFEVYEAEEGQDLDMDFQIVSSAAIVGKNAYELAVEQGYEGTLGDWLADIVHDANYVHTDNNFTDEYKSKVDNVVDVGVWEINASGTITGTIPNITIAINDYASLYADLVDANTQGKVPVVRMHLTQGGNVYEYSGIASSYNGWQFVGTFQMQGNYVSYNVFNRPTDTVPYEIDVVRLQEQLVSGTNIKTVNNQSLLGAGNINIESGGLQSFEFIECNVTAVDASGAATVSNPNWATDAIAAYNAKKIPVLYGSIQSGISYAILLMVEPYASGDYRVIGSSCVYEYQGTGSYKRTVLYAKLESTHIASYINVVDFQEKLVSGENVKTINNNSLLGSGNISLQEPLVSGENIKTINGNSLVGSGNVEIPTGLSVAYEVVDAGMLYLDQTNTYYEVPATVYTALKTVWDAGKVPVLVCTLVDDDVKFVAVISKNAENKFFGEFFVNSTRYQFASLEYLSFATGSIRIVDTYQKPSGGIPASDLSQAVQTSLGKADTALQEASVFVATRGVTTYNEIVAAYNAGKAIYCVDGSRIGYLENSPINNNTVYFTSILQGVASLTQCTSDSTWSAWTTSLEVVSNKTNDISTNKTSTTKYPSTKGVADYVDGIVGDINTILDNINGEVI